ncbi:SRPBCC family protein [Azospirillum halopraeferens]|uniref:SRPBCC family protein n=1 Tax=Azospirillum halopraeferens TaxID=34010 RepID=UPI0012EC44CB|nr:SRPBCC family protein [Azospirillum halopraeferens]
MAGTAERWTAIMGGVVLGLAGARRGDWLGLALAAAGGGLVLAGAGAVPLAERVRDAAAMRRAHPEPRTVQANVTIRAGREAVFRHWRNLSHLPRLMDHLDRVEVLSATRSRWVARGPGGVPVVWHSVIDKERPDELISWHTEEGADLPHRGSVLFRDAPGGRGTEVSFTLAYDPPGGAGGRAVAALFGAAPEQQAREALRRLKCLMETGTQPTIAGQPRGGRAPGDRKR